jgi:hypothetical protein
MSRSELHGFSPNRLGERARVAWDLVFIFTCTCQPREARFEAGGMRCARCDRPIVRRRATS